MLCQNEKNRIPLTQRNLAGKTSTVYYRRIYYSRTGRKGLRSFDTATQNIAKQLKPVSNRTPRLAKQQTTSSDRCLCCIPH